ncbi:MAG: helix-turn-helix transcriptional regulator [Pseudolabrys sp.]|nr:helix-turn-helix transcriptional regulator [Pseudolabrys sp.]
MNEQTHSAKGPEEAKLRRREAGAWLKDLRQRAGMSQMQLADRLGYKYYTFIAQVENGHGRVPTDGMEAWSLALGQGPSSFARHLLSFYDPELHRLLFEVKPGVTK